MSYYRKRRSSGSSYRKKTAAGQLIVGILAVFLLVPLLLSLIPVNSGSDAGATEPTAPANDGMINFQLYTCVNHSSDCEDGENGYVTLEAEEGMSWVDFVYSEYGEHLSNDITFSEDGIWVTFADDGGHDQYFISGLDPFSEIVDGATYGPDSL